MVDLNNRLTTKLIDVGTTSMVIYVEWPLDIEIPHGWFYLVGKLDIKKRGWHDQTFLEVDHAQGKATFDIPYTQLSWTDPDHAEKFKDFEKKAFFAIRIPGEVHLPSGVAEGKYEEDDEIDEIAGKPPVAKTETEIQQGEVKPSSPSREREEQIGNRNDELGEEKLQAEPQENTSSHWLYLVILPCVLALLYLMRKKKQ